MISPRRYFLTADGKVVEDGDERAHTLLVGRGCFIADKDAKKHGIFIDNALPPNEETSETDAKIDEVSVVIGSGDQNLIRITGVFLNSDDAAEHARENDLIICLPFNTALPDGHSTGACEFDLQEIKAEDYFAIASTIQELQAKASEMQSKNSNLLEQIRDLQEQKSSMQAELDYLSSNTPTGTAGEGASENSMQDETNEKLTPDQKQAAPADDKAVKTASNKAVTAPPETK